VSKGPKEYLALYKSDDEWKLITREVSTYKHAIDMATQYKEHGHRAEVISIKEALEVSLAP
jgi:hypothetical protein